MGPTYLHSGQERCRQRYLDTTRIDHEQTRACQASAQPEHCCCCAGRASRSMTTAAHARAVGGARVGHDGGGVGVDQDDLITLRPAPWCRQGDQTVRQRKVVCTPTGIGCPVALRRRPAALDSGLPHYARQPASLECLARLGPGVVELAGLTDDDGAGAQDHDPAAGGEGPGAAYEVNACGCATNRSGGRGRQPLRFCRRLLLRHTPAKLLLASASPGARSMPGCQPGQ